MKNDIKPPDFSSGWKLTKRQSMFVDFRNGNYIFVPAKDSHREKKNWFGWISDYEKDDGLGQGREIDFFGQGSVLKYWGLKPIGEDERFEFLAVLHESRWHILSPEFYREMVGICAASHNPLVGIMISIYREADERHERDYIIAFKIAKPFGKLGAKPQKSKI